MITLVSEVLLNWKRSDYGIGISVIMALTATYNAFLIYPNDSPIIYIIPVYIMLLLTSILVYHKKALLIAMGYILSINIFAILAVEYPKIEESNFYILIMIFFYIPALIHGVIKIVNKEKIGK